MLTYAAIHTRALKIWRDNEMTYPSRVRRMTPDDLDMASGAWGRVFEQAARELGWNSGDEVDSGTIVSPGMDARLDSR